MNKYGAKTKSKDKHLSRVVGSFVMLGVAAVICFLTVFTWVFNTDVFGWLVNSDKSNIRNVSLATQSEFDLDISLRASDGGFVIYEKKTLTLDFSNIFCGAANSRTLEIEVTNNESEDLYLSWFFGSPGPHGGAETPLESGGKYYYLGSQLAVTGITVVTDGSPVTLPSNKTPGLGAFLVPTTPLDGGQATSVGSAIGSVPGIDLLKDILIPGGKTSLVTITITFVDNGEDQSIYQNFPHRCSRVLYFKALEGEE
ncbi:MAG TPA: hypothetical protein PKH08_03280 [Clostridia bacterium]|nr:hypothetical protein [Clostridia bacterium]